MGTLTSLIQGTDEWIEYKRHKFGASEASAMLNISSKMTRNELLFKKFTGLEKEYSDYVKGLFLKGHEAEESARAIIELQLGEELFPAVYESGPLIASVDGITADGKTAFEHKLFNIRLHDSLSKGILPDEYKPQAQQILLVTEADELLFVCSNGGKDSMASVIVQPDKGYFKKIEQGWTDFKRDLDNCSKHETGGYK